MSAFGKRAGTGSRPNFGVAKPMKGTAPRGSDPSPWVPERVSWSVRMHADAKRYLCATEPEYFERLSSVSRHTLRLQGGVMSPGDAARFAEHRWVRDAVALRRWDDEAKIVGKKTRSLEDWSALIRRWFDR